MRTLALVALPLALAGCAHLVVSSPAGHYDEGRAGPARLVTREGLALAAVEGAPEAIGAQLAALTGGALRALRDEFFELVPPAPAERARALAAGLPDDHRRELQALARGAGVPYGDALVANVIVDSACTAFVASGAATATGELLFARNMDFPPAHLLGPRTLVTLVRPAGKKAFVSIGWPGVTGVISGMNEDGLCAAILINMGGRKGGPGEATPLTFVVREVLEVCATVDEARALLRAREVASGHFVFVADATSGAIVAPGEPDRLPGPDGLLTCSNDAFAPEAGLQTDARARALSDLLRARHGALDVDGARAVLGGTYLDYINAQAMVFEPARRAVSLALGTTLRPAAVQGWTRLELGRALDTGDLEQVAVRRLRSVAPAPHYRTHPYPGEAVDAGYVAGVLRRADDLEADPALDDLARAQGLAALSFQADRRLEGAAKDALQAALTARLVAALERLDRALDAAPTPAAAEALERAAWAAVVFSVPLSPEQERRRAALEARARAVRERA
ncbi:MAG: C45 family peptidase [Planctomycetes bacterium]|nr:C45 family peptidase [Planctomycetota bacterium]